MVNEHKRRVILQIKILKHFGELIVMSKKKSNPSDDASKNDMKECRETQRTELANLVGRLLAFHWLQKDRVKGHDQGKS